MDCQNNFTESHSASDVARKPFVAVIVALIAVLFAAIAFNALPGIGAQKADAITTSNGAKVQWLYFNVKHSGWDITGDKKGDTFRIYSTRASSGRTSIYVNVNGRSYILPSFSPAEDIVGTPRAMLVTLKNKKPFLYVSAERSVSWSQPSALYQFKGGKFKKVADGNAPTSNYGMNEWGELKKVSGNSITLTSTTFNYTVGALQMDRKYVYKSGTLKRASKSGAARVQTNGSTPRAKKSISVYKNTKCTKKKFTIKRGSKVKFTGYYQSGKRLVLKVKSGGRTGWVKLTTDLVNKGMLSSNPPFSNTNYRWY